MFVCLPFCGEDRDNSLEQTIDDIEDFDCDTEKQIKSMIKKIQNKEILPVEDDYSEEVRLKDNSMYAYAPRRFAHAERLAMRQITDDLLEWDIIQPSVSPYCARVIPVRKKNDSTKLCVDLRPLNSKIIKQKYLFPIIEDCLARLGNNKVFTLLDLRDSFHQIKVNPNSTKYFSFATPDGQFEYKKLPFGYCEAPAEFQKRLIQILNLLIREDKMVVYMYRRRRAHSVSISLGKSENIKGSLILLLKKYGFELNLTKYKFLRKKIEFLGYIISDEGITLSTRYTEAIKKL